MADSASMRGLGNRVLKRLYDPNARVAATLQAPGNGQEDHDAYGSYGQ